MKTTVKFAVAAIVLIAAILSLTLFKTVTPAYALEQTIQASHSVRSIHILVSMPQFPEKPMLMWGEFFENGQPKRIRLNTFILKANSAGMALEITWKEGLSQYWVKDLNKFSSSPESRMPKEVQTWIEKYDPRLLFGKLQAMQNQGQAELLIDQPADPSKPVQITTTFAAWDSYFGDRMIVQIDQATKLAISLTSYSKIKTGYQEIDRVEFKDYNQSFDDAIFALNIPDNAQYENTSLEPQRETKPGGLEQGQMTGNQTAQKVVEQFWQKLFEDNYEAAGQMMYGVAPSEILKNTVAQHVGDKIVRILSVGPADLISEKQGFVPCTIEIEKDGQISQQNFVLLLLRSDKEPYRWSIGGGL